MIIRGVIKKTKNIDENTQALIQFEQDVLDKISKYGTSTLEIRIDDGRTISNNQRAKIFATIKDLSNYTGDEPEYLKEFLKYDYCSTTGERYFSLSDCSIDTAREFISHILEFALRENIPLSDLGLNRTDDINRYLAGCIKHKVCCICGKKPSDLHHTQTLGMGADRRIYDDSNNEKIQLCRQHHNEAHQIGVKAFTEKYKVYGIIYKGD